MPPRLKKKVVLGGQVINPNCKAVKLPFRNVSDAEVSVLGEQMARFLGMRELNLVSRN